MSPFTYYRPRSLAEVFDLRTNRGPNAALLSGGTDLMVGLRRGSRKVDAVIDLKDTVELDHTVSISGDRLRVGAMTTMTMLLEDARVGQVFPALAEAAAIVGSVQIRNRATLAGNVCNASPAADTVPALLIHEARLCLRGLAGTRWVPLAEFLLGPGRADLQDSEVVTALDVRLPPSRLGTSFGRVTRRLGVDLASVNICCSADDEVVRLALGAVGPRAVVVEDTSGLLADADGDDAERWHLLDGLLEAATPISDMRASANYRRAMLGVHARRAVTAAIARRDEKVRND